MSHVCGSFSDFALCLPSALIETEIKSVRSGLISDLIKPGPRIDKSRLSVMLM